MRQVKGVAGRIREGSEGFAAIFQPGPAQFQHPCLSGTQVIDKDVQMRLLGMRRVRELGRGVILDLEIQMELLRALLAGPLRRNVTVHRLEKHLLAAGRPDIDPAAVAAGDLPAGEIGIELGECLGVPCVGGSEIEASGDCLARYPLPDHRHLPVESTPN